MISISLLNFEKSKYAWISGFVLVENGAQVWFTVFFFSFTYCFSFLLRFVCHVFIFVPRIIYDNLYYESRKEIFHFYRLYIPLHVYCTLRKYTRFPLFNLYPFLIYKYLVKNYQHRYKICFYRMSPNNQQFAVLYYHFLFQFQTEHQHHKYI